MWRILVLALLLAACAQLPPSPEDVQAKKFDSVPGKSVIYLVRSPLDSSESSGLILNDRMLLTTFPSSYQRLEVEPGTHRIAGFGFATESVTLTTQAGKVYFLEHTVLADRDDGGVIGTGLRQVGDDYGRTLVMGAQLLM